MAVWQTYDDGCSLSHNINPIYFNNIVCKTKSGANPQSPGCNLAFFLSTIILQFPLQLIIY